MNRYTNKYQRPINNIQTERNKESRYIRKIKNEIRHGNIFNFRCKGTVIEIVQIDKDKYKARVKVGEIIYEIPINQNISLPNIVYENEKKDLDPILNVNDVVEISVFKILKK